mgnify:CR=1 FL=1
MNLIETLKKDRENLNNLVVSLELQLKRTKDQLEQLEKDFFVNSGALSAINNYINQFEKDKTEQQIEEVDKTTRLIEERKETEDLVEDVVIETINL